MGDTCTYQSTCSKAQRYTTKCGFWGWKRCTRYRSVSQSCTQTSSCDYRMVSCDPCSKSCNGGAQVCRYQCRGSLCSLPDLVNVISCNTQHCIINIVFSDWSSWTNGTCSVTCDRGTQVRTRNRTCTNPEPQYVTQPCFGITTESKLDLCNLTQCLSANGGWSDWGDWKWSNECSRSCNGGKRLRYKTRSCTNPAPSNAGKQCTGETYQFMTVECNTQDCPDQSREKNNPKRLMNALLSDEFTCADGDEREKKKQCEKFQVCIDGTWQEMTCNKGTVYNVVTGACNWPANVPGCTNTSDITTRDSETLGEDAFECKSADCGCEAIIDGMTEHPTDCTKFIICLGGNHYVDSCDKGSYWEQSKFSCQPGTC
ncbi:hypothetical protein CHS0354_016056 [Potamilus streckersoni]|uniref:Chitin-binding type-2 domain-containing protein n=1 Tax=Potamilus streckersoni TaxID=2493646 RepID=A0AAE0T1A7_9BIVA|nr:hypothetical protein CHS0354_016056 [Potamilus streckersoni]